MSVEVKNLQTGETYEVGPEGASFGRDGGPANIKVADQSVSKRHARIFSDGTEWFLEDMGSVNGTIVDGGKIAGITPLRAGLVFQMSKFKFEVLAVDGRGPDNRDGRGGGRAQAVPTDQETRTAMRNNGQNGNALPSDLRKDPIPKKRPGRDALPPISPLAPPAMGAPFSVEPTNLGGGRNNNLPLASDGDFPSQSLNPQSLPEADGPRPMLGIDQYDDEISPMGALGLGIGYVLKTAPLLVLNPIGTVRNQIESPPLTGLEKIPLAAFLFPTYAIVVLCQMWAGVLGALIAGGGFSVGTFIVGPIAAVIGGGISAVIAGFLGHLILAWLVDKLGGTSDARSRTTHLAMAMASVLVLLIPFTLATLITALAARLTSVSSAFALLNVIPALIMIVAMPLPLYVHWQWFRSYNVAGWFQKLLLACAILGVLLGLLSAVTTVLAAVNTMRGGSSGVVVPNVPGVDGVPGVDVVDGDPKDPKAPKDPSDPKDPKDPTGGPKDPTPKDPSPRDPVPVIKDPVIKDPVRPKDPTPTTNAANTANFGEYLAKRTAIEAALEKDPTLILEKRIAKLYERLAQDTYDAEVKAEVEVLGKRRQRDPGKRAFLERVKAVTVYQDTWETVNELHKALKLP